MDEREIPFSTRCSSKPVSRCLSWEAPDVFRQSTKKNTLGIPSPLCGPEQTEEFPTCFVVSKPVSRCLSWEAPDVFRQSTKKNTLGIPSPLCGPEQTEEFPTCFVVSKPVSRCLSWEAPDVFRQSKKKTRWEFPVHSVLQSRQKNSQRVLSLAYFARWFGCNWQTAQDAVRCLICPCYSGRCRMQ